MSHLVLQFRGNSAFCAATDHHEQRSQRRAAQLRTQSFPVPLLLLATGQSAEPAEQQQPDGRPAADSALGYEAALGACDFDFTDDWDRGQMTSLLLKEPQLQRIQLQLQPSHVQGGESNGDAVVPQIDLMQLARSGSGGNAAGSLLLGPDVLIEPVVLPQLQQQVRLHAAIDLTSCAHVLYARLCPGTSDAVDV